MKCDPIEPVDKPAGESDSLPFDTRQKRIRRLRKRADRLRSHEEIGSTLLIVALLICLLFSVVS